MKQDWLSRPGSVRLLWLGFAAVLALTVAAQCLLPVHGYFALDGRFAFFAWYGFLACVGMVLIARLLGFVLKRPDTYYGDADA